MISKHTIFTNFTKFQVAFETTIRRTLQRVAQINNISRLFLLGDSQRPTDTLV